jgi:peptidyl-prolyl cis-trans isomerase D
MSVIQKIRDKYAALAIAVIAIAMVGFILIDALSSRTGGGLFNKNSTTVGKVNGEKIELVDFDNQLKRAEQSEQSRGVQVSEEMREEINNQLWRTTVDQKLQSDQIDKLGLVFTPKELDELLYSNPPEALREKFTDPKTGQYNAAAVAQTIKELKRKPVNDPERLGLEDYIDNQLVKEALRNKYIIMLMGAAYYPKWLAEKDNQDNSALASVSYIAVPYTAVQDASISVSDDEINTYIRGHKAQYITKEGARSIKYVSFNADPSPKDSSVVLAQINSLRAGFADTKDAPAYLNQNGTALPFYDGYVPKSMMMIPVKDSIMALPVDATFGPYIDRNASGTSGSYVVAKMLEKRDLPDSVKCRHILISTQNGAVPDSVAKQRIDSIVAVLQKGGDFKALAAGLSDDQGSKDKGGEYTFAYSQAYSQSGQGGLLKPFADFIFYGKTGDKKVVKTDAGYHYIEILDQQGVEPYYKVAYLSKEILPSDETVNTANAAATRFAADAQGGGNFDEIAQKYKTPVLLATMKETEFDVQGIGTARRLVKWAFDNKLGTVGDPENFGNKYIVANITGEQDAGLPTGAAARTLVESLVRKEKKGNEIIAKLGAPTDLNTAGAKYNVTVQHADSISFSSIYVPNLGSEPKVVGAAFNKANGNKVSAPFPGTTGVYVLRTESVTSVPNQNNDYSLIRQNMEGEMRESIGRYSQEGLFESANIVDSRIKFY